MTKKIIILFLVLFIIAGGVWYMQKNKVSVEKGNLTCTDSDNGKNIYTKGSAVSKDSQGSTLHITSDSCAVKNTNASSQEAQYTEGLSSCSGSNCYVLEAYCGEYQGGPIDAKEFIKCPNGCNDGACISK
jgi:hypothetical protein